MTIQRQYNSPNCKLVVEGWDNDAQLQPTADGRPLLSMVVNVECYIAGSDGPITGGREFLDNLVQEVNRYAQECLSGVPHPAKAGAPSGLVELQHVDGDRHRLIVYPPHDSNGSMSAVANGDGRRELDLMTVQLFDLVEAVDQLVADAQTLPDLSLNLTSVPKRYAKSQEPAPQRAIPAAIGVSGLAAAAIAFFAIPAPEFRPPEPDPVRNEQLEDGAVSGDAAGEPPTDIVNDAAVLPDEDITPAEDSAPETEAEAESAEPDAEDATSELESDVALETSDASATSATLPDEEAIDELLSTAELIADPDRMSELTQDLRDRIDDAWSATPTFDEDLVYRVGVSEAGEIIGFKYVNDPALEYVDETPLLELGNFPTDPAAAADSPIGQFRVVFRPDGVLEVSPWYGRPSNE